MSAPAVAKPKPDSVLESVRTIAEKGFNLQQARNATHEDIARLAYALWEQRGCPHGSAEFDWFEAETAIGSK